jgi:hypothetical protein
MLRKPGGLHQSILYDGPKKIYNGPLLYNGPHCCPYGSVVAAGSAIAAGSVIAARTETFIGNSEKSYFRKTPPFPFGEVFFLKPKNDVTLKRLFNVSSSKFDNYRAHYISEKTTQFHHFLLK